MILASDLQPKKGRATRNLFRPRRHQQTHYCCKARCFPRISHQTGPSVVATTLFFYTDNSPSQRETMTSSQDDNPNNDAKDLLEEPDDEKKGKRRRKRKRKKESSEIAPDDEAEVPVDNDYDPKTIQLDRTVFVEGIPYTCTPQEVKKFFTENGVEDIVECRLPVWQDTGRLRGYGHVVFDTKESQQTALQLNGKYLQNRYLTIQAANAPKTSQAQVPSLNSDGSKPSKTVMLNNLSYDASESDIQRVMEAYGAIATGGVRVVRHSQSQRSKGFAYVEFESIDSAQKAVQNATQIIVLARPCRVEYDHGRIKGSFRDSNGKLWQKEFSNKKTRSN
jgi:nucleolin